MGVGLIRNMIGVGFLDFGVRGLENLGRDLVAEFSSGFGGTRVGRSHPRPVPINFIGTNLRPFFISTMPRPD